MLALTGRGHYKGRGLRERKGVFALETGAAAHTRGGVCGSQGPCLQRRV